jgi:cytochrome c-type biogenesis protein CcmH/NrfF
LRGEWRSRMLIVIRMAKHRLILVVAVVGAFLGAPALAKGPEMIEAESLADPKTEAAAYEIAQRTMSPFCPGRTLADCPSGKATEWRQDIRAMLAQGKSPAEIQQVLSDRAGTNLTGAPTSSIGWALPAGLCLGAVAILGLVLVRFRRKDENPDTADQREELDADDAVVGDDLEARLRRELAEVNAL